MEQGEFYLDDSNIYLKNAYEKENYKEVIINPGKELCYIFFSSNGIYYPNTVDEFIKTIERMDRYEWKNTADSLFIRNNVGKVIFVRDIYKTFYQKGINTKVDTIEKLCEFLKSKTQGYRVITCGSSAGGYMAALAGVWLNAVCVFDFSGHWSLVDHFKDDYSKYYFLEKNKFDTNKAKWYSLQEYCKNSEVPIFWFYAAKNQQDKVQAECIGSAENIYIFSMDSEVHGFTLLSGCFEYIISLNIEQLKELHQFYDGKLIGQRQLCIKVMPFMKAIMTIWKDIVRCHKSLQIIGSLLNWKKRRNKNSD